MYTFCLVVLSLVFAARNLNEKSQMAMNSYGCWHSVFIEVDKWEYFKAVGRRQMASLACKQRERRIGADRHAVVL